MHVIFAAAVFLTCSQQHVVDVLAVASLGTCSATAAAAAADLFRQDKYINIVMYITMPIPQRVVMTEIKFTQVSYQNNNRCRSTISNPLDWYFLPNAMALKLGHKEL